MCPLLSLPFPGAVEHYPFQYEFIIQTWGKKEKYYILPRRTLSLLFM